MPVLKDITGKTYGHFTVISRARSLTLNCGTIRSRWVLRCEECLHDDVFMTRDLNRNRWIKCENCETRTSLKEERKNG